MANTKILRQSFGGGELSESMFGRIDDTAVQNGLSVCRNFIVRPEGAVENRAGFQFVRATKKHDEKCRLIPFQFSSEQTFVIEMGAGYFRFHTFGETLLDSNGSLYEIENPYFETELFDVHYVQSGDVLTLVHRNHQPMELRRLSADRWELKPIEFTPSVRPPASISVDANKSGDEGNPNKVYYDTQYCVTAISFEDGSESVISKVVTANNNIYVTGNTNNIKWASSEGAKYYKVYKRTSGLFGYIGQTSELRFVDDNIAPDLSITPPQYDEIFLKNGIVQVMNPRSAYKVEQVGRIFNVSVSSGGRGYYLDPDQYDLVGVGKTKVHQYTLGQEFERRGEAGAKFRFVLKDDTGTGAALRVSVRDNGIAGVEVLSSGNGYTEPKLVLQRRESSGFDWKDFEVDQKAVLDFSIQSDAELVVDDETGRGAALIPVIRDGYLSEIQVANRGYGYKAPRIFLKQAGVMHSVEYDGVVLAASSFPSAVSYFQQRRVFAGTNEKPLHVWMTKTGTESNMSYSLPVKDDDRISFKLASREASLIQHIVPLNKLILMTGSAEWNVNTMNTDYLTPKSISVSPQSYIGSSMVQPVIANNSLIYAAARGGHVRELAYNWQAGGYVTGDLSIRSPHLFENKKVVDIALQKAPYPVVWFAMSDGKLLGLTYIPEQNIGSWHRHDTDGFFESVATVIEGDDDVLYAVVRRVVQGQNVRYIERMKPRRFSSVHHAFFVDSGLSYHGAPVDRVGGLHHLEGKTVSILADGNVMPETVVSGGAVDLPVEASSIHVGLPIQAEITTVPIAFQVDAAFGSGRMKNVNKAWVRLYESSGVSVAHGTVEDVEFKQRKRESLGLVVEPVSGEVEVTVRGQWNHDACIFLKQSYPLPATVLSITAEIAVG